MDLRQFQQQILVVGCLVDERAADRERILEVCARFAVPSPFAFEVAEIREAFIHPYALSCHEAG